MGFKRLTLLLFIHLELFFLGSLVFILLFRTPLFRNVDVFFYRGILLLLSSSLLILATSLFIKVFSKGTLITFRDVFISVILVFSVNLVFFTHLPVTADRSVSVFLLSYMAQNSDKSFSEDEINNVFLQKYVVENENMDKRIKEQIVSGNIAEEKNNYIITKRGSQLVGFFNLVADLFNIDLTNLGRK